MDGELQVLVNGVIAGMCIGLLALAFQVVYMPTRVFFLGVAGIYVVAPYLFNIVMSASGSVALAILAAIVAAVGLAVAMEWLNHRPLVRRGAAEGAHFISSLGIYILLMQATVMVANNDSRQLALAAMLPLDLGALRLTTAQIVTVVASLCVLAPFFAILRRSRFGLRMRALSDSPVQFALYGYDVDRARILAFGLAGALAAIVALLAAYDVGFDPHTGLTATSLAIVAVFSGGRRSFVGPVLCGVLLGVIRSQVSWNFSARWQDAFTFAIMALFIMLRPEGLFGRRSRVEALGA